MDQERCYNESRNQQDGEVEEQLEDVSHRYDSKEAKCTKVNEKIVVWGRNITKT